MTTPATTTATTPAPLEGKALWDAVKADYYAGRDGWVPTTKDMYWEMLEILPPARMRGGAFLVGEEAEHKAGEAVFCGFRKRHGVYEARYLTVREFDALFAPAPAC